MSKDRIGDRYNKKQGKRKLDDRAVAGLTPEEAEVEREIRETAQVEQLSADQTPGRNDPCSCGSGKKYKKCCGAN